MTYYKINLDLLYEGTQLVLSCKKGDTERGIAITLHRSGVPVILTKSHYAVFIGKKPDGNNLINDCVIDMTNNCIRYDFTPQTISAEGIVVCEIDLFDVMNECIASPTFVIRVRKDIAGGIDLESTSEYNTLNTIINDIKRRLENGEFNSLSVVGAVLEKVSDDESDTPDIPDIPDNPDIPDVPGDSAIINFTINGKTYQAEEGMTFTKWVESSYNTDGYRVKDDGSISPRDSDAILMFYQLIVLSGELIGKNYNYTHEVSEEPEVPKELINQIRNSINADGTPYGANGYKSDTRINSTDGLEIAAAGHCATGYIPVTSADKIYIKGITYTDEDKPRIGVYDSSKTNLKSSSFAATGYGWASESNGVWTIDVKTLKSSGVAFCRFSAIGFTDETILTVNQPIGEKEPDAPINKLFEVVQPHSSDVLIEGVHEYTILNKPVIPDSFLNKAYIVNWQDGNGNRYEGITFGKEVGYISLVGITDSYNGYTRSLSPTFTADFGTGQKINQALWNLLKEHDLATPEEPAIINFTINGKTYQAEEGMTFTKWVESSYNTDGYRVNGLIVSPQNSDAYLEMYGLTVSPTDTISKNVGYTHEVSEEPEVPKELINQIRNSINADGTPYGANGYKSDTRINSTDGLEIAAAGHCATGYIPVTSADKVYIKGFTYTGDDKPRFAVYDSSKTNLKSSSFEPTGYGWATVSNGVWTIDVGTLKSSGVAFCRFSAIGFTDETILTVNQPIGEDDKPNLISFTIDDTTYQAESGMEWGAWVDSPYNTGSFKIIDNIVRNKNGEYVYDENNNDLLTDTAIQANAAYTSQESSGGEPEEPDVPDVPTGIINQIPICTNADGTPFVGENGEKGYKSNTRWDRDTDSESTVQSCGLTGFIPVTSADKIYVTGFEYDDEIKPIIVLFNSSKEEVLLDSSFTYTGYVWATEENGVWTIDVTKMKSGVAFCRFSALGMTDETILTVNQPIGENSVSYYTGNHEVVPSANE